MWCLTFMGEVIDAFDDLAHANQAALELYRDVKAGKLPDFLDPEDIEGVSEFRIEWKEEVR